MMKTEKMKMNKKSVKKTMEELINVNEKSYQYLEDMRYKYRFTDEENNSLVALEGNLKRINAFLFNIKKGL